MGKPKRSTENVKKRSQISAIRIPNNYHAVLYYPHTNIISVENIEHGIFSDGVYERYIATHPQRFAYWNQAVIFYFQPQIVTFTTNEQWHSVLTNVLLKQGRLIQQKAFKGFVGIDPKYLVSSDTRPTKNTNLLKDRSLFC